MTIREATIDDADGIAPLIVQLGYPADGANTRTRLSRLLGRDDYRVLVVESTGKLLGVGAIQILTGIHDDEPIGMIMAMVVEAEARGAGIGKMLVEGLESFARESGCKRILVTSAEHRAGAHAFYQRIGYSLTGRRLGRMLD